jgi:60S ribosomal protein uL30
MAEEQPAEKSVLKRFPAQGDTKQPPKYSSGSMRSLGKQKMEELRRKYDAGEIKEEEFKQQLAAEEQSSKDEMKSPKKEKAPKTPKKEKDAKEEVEGAEKKSPKKAPKTPKEGEEKKDKTPKTPKQEGAAAPQIAPMEVEKKEAKPKTPKIQAQAPPAAAPVPAAAPAAEVKKEKPKTPKVEPVPAPAAAPVPAAAPAPKKEEAKVEPKKEEKKVEKPKAPKKEKKPEEKKAEKPAAAAAPSEKKPAKKKKKVKGAAKTDKQAKPHVVASNDLVREIKAVDTPKTETDVKTPAPKRKASAPIQVPEILLKKRKTLETIRAARLAKQTADHKKKATLKHEAFKRAEKYVSEFRAEQKDKIRLHREAVANGNIYVEGEAKVVFVVRIAGINRVSPKVRKVLQLLRLRQIHNGVFVKMNKATANMLKLVDPYVTYGYPTLKSVRHLIYKRGNAKIDKQRIPLKENGMIEKHLKSAGIVCMEDLVHELYTCGPHFKEATTFLWPFKLNAPRGGLKHKATHFVDGGDFGNREELINDFIAQLV